jgi:xanthine/uracil permease
MLTTISAALLSQGSFSFLTRCSVSMPLPTGWWEEMLAPVAVLGVVVTAIGFLFLVSRLSWAAREFVATCRERQKAHRKLVEMLHQHLEQMENQDLGVEQLWSASSALSAC